MNNYLSFIYTPLQRAACFVGSVVTSPRFLTCLITLFVCVGFTFAQDPGAIGGELSNVAGNIQGWIEPVRSIVYALAAVVALVGSVSVYIKMNNEDTDVKKSIMMIVGAVLFLLAAATALPSLFGN